jgi:glycyl-tRNA synthetase
MTQIDELKHVASIQDKLRIQNFDRSVLEQILIKRFFLAPSFQIYGGIAGLFDYGPPGCALQSNILNLWRLHFCLEEDMLELECTNLTPEIVLKVRSWILLISR